MTSIDSEFDTQMMNWLMTFARRSLGEFHQFTREAGLTMPQMNVLLRLYYHGASDVSGLIDTMLGSKAAASQMVERLVQQELVERHEAPGDRRAKRVQLTEKGRQIIESSIASRQAWLKRLGAGLDETQKVEISRAIRLLNEAADRLSGPSDTPDTACGHRMHPHID
jgi:DNA-binding MarR family transcriptional regulator